MKRDIEGLEITKGEIKKLTGIDTIDNLNSNPFDPIIWGTLYLSIIWGIPLHYLRSYLVKNYFELLKVILEILEVPGDLIYIFLVILPSFLISIGMAFSIKQTEKRIKNNKTLMKLKDEMTIYNNLIKNIDILDQLESAGNPISLADREKVIEALKITRENLVRAFKTERILR